MTEKRNEGLIPVQAPPYPGHSPVSSVTPHEETIQPAPVSEQVTGTYVYTDSEKAPLAEPAHAPSDVKAYPGQPAPEQVQQLQQPQVYYTPHVHPSGYVTATPLHSLQSAPCPVDCPACGQREMTRVEAVTGMTTHGWAAVLCFCCCLGCIPYLMSSLKDQDHYCGKCGVKLACWHNSGRVQVFQSQRQP